uniref:Uncharacterized protein n=1 Tax=Anguilla anguilla TaxID=7936 RepID=A0A0E9W9W9_ANGAN
MSTTFLTTLQKLILKGFVKQCLCSQLKVCL